MSGRAGDESQLGETVPSSPAPPSPAASTLADPSAPTLDASQDRSRGTATLQPGAAIARYRLTARLGAGAMGEVWSAFDPQLERKVAIKLLHPDLARTPEISARMVREARAMAKVSHKGVVAIHDAGEAEGRLFLAMELVSGTTLGALLRARSVDDLRDWRRWLAMLIEAGRGLAAAHAAGVWHRDFKPDNVLVDTQGRVCVGDFGLASIGASGVGRASLSTITAGAPALDLTTTGSLLGTPVYMSLEQLHGADVDARADQFSFCVATYETLYGVRPFEVPGERVTLAGLAAAIDAGALQPPPLDSTVPASTCAVVVRGLAADPAARWPDLPTLLNALEEELRPVVPSRGPRQRRRRAVAVAVAVAVAAAGLATVAIAVRGQGASAPRTHAMPSAQRIGPVPLRATLAMSPGGRLAIGTDRVEVREFTTDKTWRTSLQGTGPLWVFDLQFDGEDVVRWGERAVPGAVRRWRFVEGAESVIEPGTLDGRWLGGLAAGEIVTRFSREGGRELALIRDGHTVRTWALTSRALEMFAIAPSRHRFAYFENDRFAGRIVVVDATTNERWTSDQIVEPTGIAWSSDQRLVYSTAGDAPAIAALPVTEAGLGHAKIVHRLASGSVGRLVAIGRRIFFTLNEVTTRVRVIDRDRGSLRDYDPSVAGASLGWTADGSFLMWNRGTTKVERWSATRAAEPTEAVLASEPANATLADELLIASLRSTGGRELTAVSVSTGQVAWSHPKGASLVARCARDLHPPCYVARRIEAPRESYEIVVLDPRTGETSGPPLYRGSLEDLAVRDDGDRILIADGTKYIRELDRTGTVVTELTTPLSVVRSLAFDPRGGVLVAGTALGGSYAVARHDGEAFATLAQADGQLLSLVRPDTASGVILMLGRSLSAELWQLDMPEHE